MRLSWMVVGIAMLGACNDETCTDWPSGGTRCGNEPVARRDAGADAVDAGVDAAGSERDPQLVDASGVSDASSMLMDAAVTQTCQADSPVNTSGARIHVEGERCTIPYGEGATFRYRVTLDQSVPYQVAAGTSCGFCSKLGSDVKPLTRAMVFASSDGGALSYCADCDVGCCPPDKAASYELGAQTLEGVLDWPGRTFSGPSDTGQKPGDFFTRGPAYVLITVTLPGMKDPIATAKLPITIE